MKKFVLVLAILILGSSIAAQVPKPFNLYAGGGFTKPSKIDISTIEISQFDVFDDQWKSGINGFVGVGFKMMPMLEIIGKIEYHRMKFDWDRTGFSNLASGINYQVLAFGVEGKVAMGAPASPITPYLFGGGGIAAVTFSTLDLGGLNIFIPPPGNITKPYYNIGAGVELNLIPIFKVFVQFQTMRIATKDETTSLIPFTIGLKF